MAPVCRDERSQGCMYACCRVRLIQVTAYSTVIYLHETSVGAIQLLPLTAVFWIIFRGDACVALLSKHSVL